MAKTSYLDIDSELEEKYYSNLQSADRFILPRISVKKVLLSQQKIADLTSRSYLPVCSELWNAFTEEQQQAWKDVDPHPQQHGWRTFVADQCKRIKFGIEGVATPNEYHQDMVGKILIEEPAEEIKLIQPHPSSYWLQKKVTGKKGMYEMVEISEVFALPLSISINYKADLISTGEGSFAKFYASVRHLYQGQNLNTDLEINIPLSSAWAYDTVELTSLTGLAISYNLYIHLYKVRGTLLFDNIKAEHSGSNWARDTYCKNVEQDFTRQWYQVPKNWGVVEMPEGAGYLSVYPV
jgi:hypothetical protein